MKSIFALLIMFVSAQGLALDGNSLNPAAEAAFDEASVEISLDGVEAWEASLEGDEVEVKILSHDHDSGEEALLIYGCHLHGSDMACHEEGHEGHAAPASDEDGHEFEEMVGAYQTALDKFAKTLKRQNADLSIVEAVKVWKLAEDDDHGHGHGADFWTKLTYELNGEHKVTFVQCHGHEGEEGVFCHYKREGEGEPDLGDDHDHGHDH